MFDIMKIKQVFGVWCDIAKQERINLIEFQQRYATAAACQNHLFLMKWPNGYKCEKCGHDQYYETNARKLILYECKHLPLSSYSYRWNCYGKDSNGSANDVIPTAIPITTVRKGKRLVQELISLVDAFDGKAKEFSCVLKMGRTHLQDVVPITLGQEFAAYAVAIRRAVKRIQGSFGSMLTINM